MSPIQLINAIPAIPAIQKPVEVGQPGVFKGVLENAINTVEAHRTNADAQVGKFLSGEGGELHQVVLATQQAELSLELFQQVRNKVVQAYQEIMRMQM